MGSAFVSFPAQGQFAMKVSGSESPNRTNEKEPIHREPGRGDPKEADGGLKVADVCRKHGICGKA